MFRVEIDDFLDVFDYYQLEFNSTPDKEICICDTIIDSCIFKNVRFNNITIDNVDLLDENIDIDNIIQRIFKIT